MKRNGFPKAHHYNKLYTFQYSPLNISPLVIRFVELDGRSVEGYLFDLCYYLTNENEESKEDRLQ